MRGSAQRALLSGLAALVFAALVVAHARGLNGPDYWQWTWQRRTDIVIVAIFLFLAAGPAFIGYASRKIVLIALSVIVLQFTANEIATPIRSLTRIDAVAHNQLTTGYFTVAESIVKANGIDWLAQYDQLLRLAPQHVTTKPPGPVAFYVTLIRAAGAKHAPLVIAIAISLLSACGVIVTWWAVKTIAGEEAGLIAATLLALSPSMTLFFLYLDPVYPIFSMAMLGTWYLALERQSWRAAVAFGLILFAATMTGYTLLVVGLVLGGVTLPYLKRQVEDSGRPLSGQPWAAILHAAIAVGVAVVGLALFALVTGFNPISAFRTALAMQAYQLPLLHRPWPKTIPFDILDFLLGIGWAALVPAVFGLMRRRAVTIACFALPFVIALTGLIQAETARVWIFMMPLFFVPAALEMETWTPRERFATFAAQLIVLIALYANMVFIEPASRIAPTIQSHAAAGSHSVAGRS